jgi:serine/threonine-protein kinase
MPPLFQRLKERKLFQWSLAYAAGAWLVFQGIEVLAEPWNLSEAIQRGVHISLAIGFLVVLVLAWYHGEKGRQRASGVELLVLAGILTIAGVAVATLGRGVRQGSAGGYLEEMSIAALPFENRSGQKEDEYFTDGVHDEILTRLTKISSLSVRGRTSVMQYRDTPKNLRQIGEELNARYILEGGVQRAGGTVRINLQLIDAESDEHLWAETYDRRLTIENLLTVQSEVALRVADALNAALTTDESESVATDPTDNLEAYDHYLRGLEFMNRTYDERDMRIAVQMFEDATQLDSSFALAYAKLSEMHGRLYWFRFDGSQERIQQAKQAAERSLELEPDLPEGHEALGYYYYWGLLDYDKALQALERALRRQPGRPRLLAGLGFVVRRSGDFQSALIHLEEAAKLDPRDPLLQYEVAATYQLLRDYPEAERHFSRALALAPDMIDSYAMRAWNYIVWEGSLSKARAVLAEAADMGLDFVDHPLAGYLSVVLDVWDGDYDSALARLFSGSSEAFSFQHYFIPKALLAAGIHADRNELLPALQNLTAAVALLETEIQKAPEDARLYGALGMAYAGMGRTEDAIRAGEKGVELLPVSREAWRGLWRVTDLARILMMTGQHDAAIDRIEFLLSVPGSMSVALLRVDPLWNPLRSHPRFQALMEKYDTT